MLLPLFHGKYEAPTGYHDSDGLGESASKRSTTGPTRGQKGQPWRSQADDPA